MQTTELDALNASLTAPGVNVDLNTLIPFGGGLTEGYSAVMSSMKYITTDLDLTRDQTINVDGKTTVIPAGEKALSLTLEFTDKSRVAMTVLRRSAKSLINGKSARLFSFQDFQDAVNAGKTLHVSSVAVDASTERTINTVDANNVAISRVTTGKAYAITISNTPVAAKAGK